MTYNGRYTEEIIFQTYGDKDKARDMESMGRKYLGILVNEAGFNKLQQHERTYKFEDGSVIKVKMIPGIKLLQIYVPKQAGQEEQEMEIITGFIVQLTRTSDWINGNAMRRVNLFAVEPDMKDMETPHPDNYEGTRRWLTDWGAYDWERHQQGDTPEIPWDWTGEIVDGFYRRNVNLDGYEADLNQDLLDLNYYGMALHQIEYTTSYILPATGPRIFAPAVGSIAYDDAMYDAEVYGAGAVIVTTPAANKYHTSVDYINNLMKSGVHQPVGWYQIGPADLWQDSHITATENYLMAFSTRIEKSEDEDDLFILKTDEVMDIVSNESIVKNPYATIALLPKASRITDEGAYDPSIFPDYVDSWKLRQWEISEFDQIYYNWAQDIIDDPSITTPDGDWQKKLFPDFYLHPLEGYLCYPMIMHGDFTITSNIGEPNTKPKSGYYRILAQCWSYVNSPYSVTIEDDVEYEMEITLFGSKYIGKTTVKGVTGKKNDKIDILVNTPVYFPAGKFEEAITQLLVVGH